MNIKIRKGNKSDLTAVWSMVKELADFEKEPTAVLTSIEIYEKDFDNQCFEIIVAEDLDHQKVVGMVLFFPSYSTWKGKMVYLDDFYVKPDYRGQNIGQQLFKALITRSKELGAKLLKWQVLDWNENAIRFYKNINATIEDNWYNCKITI